MDYKEVQQNTSKHSQDVHNILVALSGTPIDDDLMRMGCTFAKKKKSIVYVVHVLEIPLTLPLDAQMYNPEIETILDRAIEIAEELNCPVEAEVVQARDAGPGIVDESRERGCALIILGLIPKDRFGRFDLGRTIPYVLEHATCRVLLLRESALLVYDDEKL